MIDFLRRFGVWILGGLGAFAAVAAALFAAARKARASERQRQADAGRALAGEIVAKQQTIDQQTDAEVRAIEAETAAQMADLERRSPEAPLGRPTRSQMRAKAQAIIDARSRR